MNKELPYERFLEHGAQSLTDAELIAIILRTGVRDASATEVAQRVLAAAGPAETAGEGLLPLYDLTMEQLLAVRGIGKVKAVKLLALSEIAQRMARARRIRTVSFTDPASIASLYMERLRHEHCEKALLLLLDNHLQLRGEITLSTGTSDRTLMPVRELFGHALRAGASGIILLHNHPSGDPSPSEEDIRVTARIEEAGRLLEIPLLDHIIIGDLRYASLREEGYLQ
ncbi:MAG: DNA repair protein RadC [Lachnospiraceae bacterium]|nr:DNA repair protein RadC [Lachnospiraceae bacterium]